MSLVRETISTAARQLKNIAHSYRNEPTPELKTPAECADPNQPKDWTVLVYMEGRDRLSNSVGVALNGMEEIGSSDSVNLVAQATMVPEFGDRRFQKMGEVNTRRYFLTQDRDLDKVSSPVLADFGEQKRLEPETLKDFLAWGIKNFPASHYMVVVKKHGLGFAANGESVPLSARQMRSALEEVEKETGVKPDVIAWDSCSMQQLEVAYELKDRARVMTGSPEVIPAVEFPYPSVLHNLSKFSKQQTAETVGQTVVMAYEADAPRTIQSALSLEKLPILAARMRELVEAAGEIPREVLYTNWMRAASFEPRENLALNYNFRDVAQFLKNLSEDPAVTSERARDAARAARAALGEAQLARHVNHWAAHNKGLSSEAGVSAFLPWKEPNDKLKESYSELAWARDTGWDKLLESVLAGASDASEPAREGWSGPLYAYKKFVSPYHLSGCPYDVTCSQFAKDALAEFGLWEGSKRAFMRVVSCQNGGDPAEHAAHHHHHHDAQETLAALLLHPPAAAPKSELRKKAERLMFTSARVLGKAVGGTVAALAGAPVAAALGAVWGFKAGAGKLDEFNAGLREKYGDFKTACLEQLEPPLAGPGAAVRSGVERMTGSSWIGKTAGAIAGAVGGAALGLVGGGLFSFRYFGGFAGIGLQNMAKHAVGELAPHYKTEQILRA